MKRITAILLAFLIIGCQTGPQGFSWSTKSHDKLLAKAGEKLVMIEFFTDW